MFKIVKQFFLRYPVVLLFLISLTTRIFWLFFSMPSVTNDEADIYTSSYLFGRTLHDYYGNFGFLTTGILTAKPSVPIYIGAIPWFFTVVKSVFFARLPFVILNSITPVLLYLLIKSLTKISRLPYLSFLVFNFSPWFSYPSATGYEAIVSLFFILLFLVITLSNLDEKVKIIVSVITAFLAFNSYMGMKPVFPFILLTGSFFFFSVHKVNLFRKKIVKAFIVSLVLYAVFIGINYLAPNADLVKREYKIMLNYFDKPKIEGMVWFERWTSTGPDKLVTLFSNKYSIRLKDYLSKYLLSFNPQLFFMKGDPSALYGTADLSGLFFLTDFVFFIVGLINLGTIKERGIWFLMLFFLFGGLPITLSNTAPTFIFRGVILLIPYTLTIAYGIIILFEKRRAGFLFFIIVTLSNTLLYTAIYYVRIKNLNGEQWKYSIKQISEKVASIKKDYTKITIHNIEPQETFFQYAFYAINDPIIITNRMQTHSYSYDNVVITNDCPKTIPKKNELIVWNKENCGIPLNSTRVIKIIEPTDRSGKDYYFFTGK